MNKKTIFNKLKNIIYLVLVVSFLIIYFASEAGYFDQVKNKKVSLTNEQIARFEEDIALGKEINMEAYYTDNSEIYNNKFTKIGSLLSNKIEDIVSALLDKTFKALNDFLDS